MIHQVSEQIVLELHSSLTMCMDVEQNDVVSPQLVVLHVRRVPKRIEDMV